jgi:hypothetical protein
LRKSCKGSVDLRLAAGVLDVNLLSGGAAGVPLMAAIAAGR